MMNWFSRKVKNESHQKGYHESTSELQNLKIINNDQEKPVLITQLPSHYLINNYDEVRGLADRLKNKEDIIVNVKNLNVIERKRVVDFLSGIIYVLDGAAKRVGPLIYLFSVNDEQN